MKVLVIGSRVPFPLRDGGAIATYNLLKGLSDLGLKVDYLTLNTKKHFVDAATIQAQFGFLNAIETFYIDTSVKPLPAFFNLFKGSSYNIDRFIDETFRQNIIDRCETNQYDIIHFEGLFIADYIKGLPTNTPKILRQHNIEYKIWKTLHNTLSSGIKKWYTGLLAERLQQYEKTITHLFDAVVSITETDRQDTVEAIGYKGLSANIPAGIQASEVLNSAIDYKSLYHIGSMEWMPNQEAMKWFHDEIWPLIEKQDKEIQFYMGGKQMPETFKHFESGRFHVLGEVSNLDTFIADKSILAVPLKSGSGIRIKTIEAMMAGKVVVTTTQGAQGLELINEDNCMIADSADKFAEAILELASNQPKRDRLAEKGKLYAESHFGIKSVSKQWLDFYDLLKRGTKSENNF